MRTPELRPVFHALFALLASTAGAAPLEVKLLGVDGKGIGGTVVVLRSTDPARPLAPPVQAVMDQLDLRFQPFVLVVPAGSKVSFPNSDKVNHQVYSFSPAKRFQLPLYSGKPYAPVEFERGGTVTLGCNIHDQMRGYVYVVEAQHYGRTDAAGLWSAAQVQPGEYTVRIWHPRARDARPLIDQIINVGSSEPQITLRLAAPLKLRPESQIPASWDNY